MRIEEALGSGSPNDGIIPPPQRSLHVIRRSGDVVVIAESDVVKLKLIPAGSGKFHAPSAWGRAGSAEIEGGVEEIEDGVDE